MQKLHKLNFQRKNSQTLTTNPLRQLRIWNQSTERQSTPSHKSQIRRVRRFLPPQTPLFSRPNESRALALEGISSGALWKKNCCVRAANGERSGCQLDKFWRAERGTMRLIGCPENTCCRPWTVGTSTASTTVYLALSANFNAPSPPCSHQLSTKFNRASIRLWLLFRRTVVLRQLLANVHWRNNCRTASASTATIGDTCSTSPQLLGKLHSHACGKTTFHMPETSWSKLD